MPANVDASVTITFKDKGLETIARNIENQVTAGMAAGMKRGSALGELKAIGMAMTTQLTGGFLGPKMFKGIGQVGSAISSGIKGLLSKITGPEGAVAGIVSGGGKKGGGKGISGMISILGGILGFVMSLKPMQAVMQMIGAILTLVFMPLALMLMMFMMPFLILMLNIFKKIDMKKFMDFMMAAGTALANLVMGIGTGIYDLYFIISTVVADSVKGILFVVNVFLRAISAGIDSVKAGIAIVGGTLSWIAGLWNDFAGFVFDKFTGMIALLEKVGGIVSGGFSALMNGVGFLTGVVRETVEAVGSGVRVLASIVSNVVGGILGGIEKAIGFYISIYTTTFGLLYDFWKDYIAPIFEDIRGWISQVAGFIGNVWDWISGTLNYILGIFTNVFNDIKSVLDSIWGGISSVGNVLSGLTKLQEGGKVLSNTVAFLHAGETVVPAGHVMVGGGGGGNSSVVININAKVANDIDMRHLADTVAKAISDNRRRSVLY